MNSVPGMWLLRLTFAVLIPLGAAAPALSQDKDGSSCSVALPPKCFQSGTSEPVVDGLSVGSLDATGEQDCFDKARRLVNACGVGSGGREVVRFSRGAVEHQVDLVQAGARRPPAEVPLPIVYGKSFETEFEQFGYNPDFSPGPMSFDKDGRMLVRSGSFLQVRTKEGNWSMIDLAGGAAAAIQRVPDVSTFRWTLDTRAANADLHVFVDGRNRWYTLVQGMPTRLKAGNALSYRPYLLSSSDAGQSWTAAALAVPDERPSWRATLEHNDGNNDRSGPPPVLTFDQSEREDLRSPALFLWTFSWDGSMLVGAQTKVSDRSILVDNHSGAASSLVSTAENIYIVFPGLTDAKARGTPAYLAVYDKAKRTVASEVMLAQGGAAVTADNHNIPGVCLGRDRSIHVMLLGHQEDMRFMSGRIGSDGKASFGQPQVVGESANRTGGYTYGTLNCDAAGNVVIFSRWAGDLYHFKLVLLHRTPQGDWQTWDRRRHLVIVDPGRPFYGAWRQRAAQDASGRIYLSYAYYANHLNPAELQALKARFPFENWKIVKELQPPQCISGQEHRCFMHPMPEVTHVMLAADPTGRGWRFVP